MTDNSIDIYQRLYSLPLFQGMSREQIMGIAGNTRLDFKQAEAGETIASQGEPCTCLWMLMNGGMDVTTASRQQFYTFVEHVQAPLLMEPERLFGWSPEYAHTYTTTAPCQLLRLYKEDVLRLMERHFIFRLNLLNLLSTQMQRTQARQWHLPPTSLEERILRFVDERAIQQHTRRELYIKMTQLAALLNDSRLDISRALNRLQHQGIVELHRGRIDFLERSF